ncbi:MAG: lysophospholipid acyltransferase family protein [Actinomycetota bacterium]|nr:lysophospholipid acyltransferase family protein [Actinomycetota bacterium]
MTKIATKLTGRSVPDRIAYHVVRTIVTVFCRTWCRMQIEGRDNFPKDGPFILAPTHRSIIDTPVSSGAYTKRMRFMGADKWWSNKHFGKLLTALGGFPVTRGSADREALKRCIAVIEGGEPLVLFPEGERKSGPFVQPLFEGAAYVAMKTGAPIVPVGIGGSERVMPKGARFIYPRKMYVIVGKPLSVPLGDPAAPASAKDQRAAARRLTAELHTELQRLFDAAQAKAGVQPAK